MLSCINCASSDCFLVTLGVSQGSILRLSCCLCTSMIYPCLLGLLSLCFSMMTPTCKGSSRRQFLTTNAQSSFGSHAWDTVYLSWFAVGQILSSVVRDSCDCVAIQKDLNKLCVSGVLSVTELSLKTSRLFSKIPLADPLEVCSRCLCCVLCLNYQYTLCVIVWV